MCPLRTTGSIHTLGELEDWRGLYCRLCRRRSRRIDGSRREERGNGEGEHKVFAHRFVSSLGTQIVNVKHPTEKPADVIGGMIL
jgi:hypothetical protein